TPSLREDDAKAIQTECPSVQSVSPIVRTSAQVVAGDQNWSTQVSGVYANYLDIRSWPLASGAFFTDSDARGSTKVCVIGKTVVDNLFGGQDPIGQVIRVKK